MFTKLHHTLNVDLELGINDFQAAKHGCPQLITASNDKQQQRMLGRHH
jgi:hypothetical protein